jgi:predicted RNase H-like nuclease (RuvC/YqgF family)
MSSLDVFTITGSTTREELIARINDLDEEVQKLETKIEDQKQEIEYLELSPEQFDRLARAADEEAAWGRIHNTPTAKLRYIEGN